MARETYLVTLNRDPRLGVREMEAYIRDACQSWSGSFDPKDERCNHGKVKVKRIKR